MAVSLVRNFDTCSCSLPLANSSMRVTECDVHVTKPLNHWKQQWPECHNIPICGELIDMIKGQMDRGENFRRNFVIFMVSRYLRGKKSGELCYLDRVVFKLRSAPCQLPTIRRWINNEIRDRESVTEFGKGYLEDTMGAEDEGKAEDRIRISKVKVIDGWAEVVTELEELIPGARSPLKRVRKVATESVSDALIRDRPKRSKNRMLIDAIEKHFAGSRDKVHDFPEFAIPSLSLRVSQEEKELLLEGVVVPDSLAALVQVINSDVEDVVSLKQILGKFSKCLVESFDPYSASFELSDRQRFTVTAFDVHVMLGVPIGGREIMDITRSSTDEEYDKELNRTPEFILAKKEGGKSLKKNFIIYLVNCFFSRLKNCCCNNSILKYVKNVN
ncbi:LOW QUALITY PROTEIN: hypothetical protein Cgig2_003105 [Carnegiea gigantea]|uniref:Uncharacterized protein n=1 Tax=Carnegiea gigantea TaxID=171969 RepID=A0A9Q1K1P3_9CARY|nr:LOW QUALITY PROTEIN: hypothetical protein Cgig2_003105 [Carnegiea gigantea]